MMRKSSLSLLVLLGALIAVSGYSYNVPRPLSALKPFTSSRVNEVSSSSKTLSISESHYRMSSDMRLGSSAVAVSGEKKSSLWETYNKIMETATILFPLWTVLFAGLALTRPESFAWFSTKYFTWSLGKNSIFILNPTLDVIKICNIIGHRCSYVIYGHHFDS